MQDKPIKTSEEEPNQARTAIIRGWIIIAGIALVFVIYGLFAFFVIGDNQPPDWDFGAVKDTPGESVYSTYPYRGVTEGPAAQHVNQKPPDVVTDLSQPIPSVPVQGKTPSRKLQPGARK